MPSLECELIPKRISYKRLSLVFLLPQMPEFRVSEVWEVYMSLGTLCRRLSEVPILADGSQNPKLECLNFQFFGHHPRPFLRTPPQQPRATKQEP